MSKPEKDLSFLELEPTPSGFIVRRTDDYIIEVWRMIYNWRLVVWKPGQPEAVEHGYCFFGTDLVSLARAVAAAKAWDDPLNADPNDFDKKAF